MIYDHNIEKAAALGQEAAFIKGQLTHAENATLAAFVLDAEGQWQYAGAYYGVADQPLAVTAQASVCHALQTKIAIINQHRKSLGVMVPDELPIAPVAPIEPPPVIETEQVKDAA